MKKIYDDDGVQRTCVYCGKRPLEGKIVVDPINGLLLVCNECLVNNRIE